MGYVTKRQKIFKEKYSADEAVPLTKAVELIADFPKVGFDESVEVHLKLNTNSKSSDQNIRGTVALPHGTGRQVRVAVFCKGEAVQAAQDAGADHAGANDLIEKVANGFMDFDVVVATPDMMRDLSKLGKVLGPRGLMPSPKAGTVTTDVAKVIKEVKAGRVEFKSDKQSGIHVAVGKRSFARDKILENVNHLLDAVNHAKPASVKGQLIANLSLSTTMGPGLKIALA